MLKGSLIALGFLMAVSAAGAQSLPEMRMTPAEVQATPLDHNQIGSSAVPGVRTKVLFGDPSKEGFYVILLFVPPHTTIQAHSHSGNRMATVVSGEWHFGYGSHFDEKQLKALPQGSVYSEPGGDNHFAQTGAEPVIVEISGIGPTDTRYVDAKDDPRLQEKK